MEKGHNESFSKSALAKHGPVTGTGKRRSDRGLRRREARPIFRAWPEIASRLRAAQTRDLFLDFDGTLTRLRHRPGHVRLSMRVRSVLRRLARCENVRVAVISGRSLRDLRRMVAVSGIRYVGLHGAEPQGAPLQLSARAREALKGAKREVQRQMRDLRGIWIEEKGPFLTVHYRGASPAAAQAAGQVLQKIIGSSDRILRVLDGKKVWEILPRELSGKAGAVRTLLRNRAHSTLALYVGDDESDEGAFAVLPNGITVKVGPPRVTRAQFYLRNPTDVWRFLVHLERELS